LTCASYAGSAACRQGRDWPGARLCRAPHSKELFESVGLKVIPLKSPAEVLGYKISDTSCCIVLDVRMPEISGLKLQEELSKAEMQVPILF
jgi:FixJ family two-component response regulator